MDPAVVEVPQFGPLDLGIPLSVRIAKRVDALLRARSLLLPAGTTDHGVVVARLVDILDVGRLQKRIDAREVR